MANTDNYKQIIFILGVIIILLSISMMYMLYRINKADQKVELLTQLIAANLTVGSMLNDAQRGIMKIVESIVKEDNDSAKVDKMKSEFNRCSKAVDDIIDTCVGND